MSHGISKSEIVRKDYPIQALLNKYGVERKGSTYRCPFHTGGNNNGYSAYVGSRDGMVNKLSCSYCHSHGLKAYSVIDVYMHFENCTAKEAINALYDEMNKSIGIKIPEYEAKPVETKIEGYMDALECFTEYDDLDLRYKKRIDQFLEQRKLRHAKEIIRANGYRIGLKEYMPPWGRVCHNITFDFGTFLQSRLGGGQKFNAGGIEPKLLKVNSTRTWFIVEGITDALACAELGYNSMFINGAGNWDKLKLRKSFNYVLALDNDKAGVNAKNNLINKFKDTGISFEEFNELELENCKDMGAYVMSIY